MSVQTCPVCGEATAVNPRYPDYVCKQCASLAVDEVGRELAFFNTCASGGFIAKYVDTGEERNSSDCFVKGMACTAREARFGGIVIQPKKR